jgi:hypothetical protein
MLSIFFAFLVVVQICRGVSSPNICMGTKVTNCFAATHLSGFGNFTGDWVPYADTCFNLYEHIRENCSWAIAHWKNTANNPVQPGTCYPQCVRASDLMFESQECFFARTCIPYRYVDTRFEEIVWLMVMQTCTSYHSHVAWLDETVAWTILDRNVTACNTYDHSLCTVSGGSQDSLNIAWMACTSNTSQVNYTIEDIRIPGDKGILDSSSLYISAPLNGTVPGYFDFQSPLYINNFFIGAVCLKESNESVQIDVHFNFTTVSIVPNTTNITQTTSYTHVMSIYKKCTGKRLISNIVTARTGVRSECSYAQVSLIIYKNSLNAPANSSNKNWNKSIENVYIVPLDSSAMNNIALIKGVQKPLVPYGIYVHPKGATFTHNVTINLNGLHTMNVPFNYSTLLDKWRVLSAPYIRSAKWGIVDVNRSLYFINDLPIFSFNITSFENTTYIVVNYTKITIAGETAELADITVIIICVLLVLFCGGVGFCIRAKQHAAKGIDKEWRDPFQEALDKYNQKANAKK